MILLILFAFLGGVVTILSPCILPILPIVLSGGITGGKKRPFGVVSGFVVSFAVFTLALSSLVRATGISSQSLRNLSVIIIAFFGVSLLVPKFQELLERLFVKFSRLTPKNTTNDGFRGGFLLGVSLGLIWTPCVGPILAGVITLAATSTVTLSAAIITFAYALGTALPMLLIIKGGRGLIDKYPALSRNTANIQKTFGVLMILVALAIYFNFDRSFQTYILDKFPAYGTGLTKFEDNQKVQEELERIKSDDNILTMPAFPKAQRRAPEIIPGGEWFNSEPLTLVSLKGKVVLIDFWTYTCINCIRTLPFINDWQAKYADKGLVIIGVHTPEFEFEKDAANVAKAIADFGIKYPVVQDNDFATWRAYNNRYWPAKYFIDKEGIVRWTHFGEGEYDKSEELIQELLAETGSNLTGIDINEDTYTLFARTPETYLGYARIANFASIQKLKQNSVGSYSYPTNLLLHSFAFNGDFLVSNEYSNPQKDAKLKFYFEAKNVHLVMRPKIEGLTGSVKVYLDGELVETLIVDEDKLYDLFKLEEAGQHTLELEFMDENIEAFAFTFG